MITNKEVQNLIDEIEEKYRNCWDILSILKNNDNSVNLDVDLLRFQPLIAEALFDLNDMYQSICEEEKKTITRKSELPKDQFKERMRSLKNCKEAAQTAMDMGKGLGDSFAWLFYTENLDYLDKHLDHEPIPQPPSGIGGLGELEFIKRVPLIGEYFVLFHGITSFLREGDISLVSLEDSEIKAIGELKTRKIGDSKLETQIFFVGESEEIPEELSIAKNKFNNHPKEEKEPKNQLHPSIRQRLNKQLNSISDVFGSRDPHTQQQSDMYDAFHTDALRKLASTLKKGDIAYQQAGKGLLLVGMEHENDNLSSKILEDLKFEPEKRIIDKTQNLFDEGSDENFFILKNLDFNFFRGATPLFWWPLDQEFIKKIFFYNQSVITIYNPIHFVKKLRNIGFSIDINLEKKALTVKKDYEDGEIEIKNFGYFINAIQKHLLKEEKAIEILSNLAKETIHGDFEGHERVRINMNLHLHS